jgi:hypothetical protein
MRSSALLTVPAAALFAIHCGEPKRIRFEPPRQVDLVGVIETDSEGHLLRGTGLLPWDPEGSLTVYSGASKSGLVVGYASASLSAIGAPSRLEALAGDRLSEAKGCTPRLPPPLFAARIDQDGGLQPVEAGSVPSLTAGWVLGACPKVSPGDLSFDLSCLQFRCPSQVVQTSRCTFQMSLDCPIGAFAGTMGTDGSLCLDFSGGKATCTSLQGLDRARIASYQCSIPEAMPMDCRLDVYRAPIEPQFRVTRIPVLDVPKYTPPPGLTGGNQQLPRTARFLGYLYDLAITEAGVAISAGPGVPIEACPGNLDGQLLLYGRPQFDRTQTATAPACLTLLANDPLREPRENGLLGVFHEGQELFVGRFDVRGHFDRRRRALLDPRRPAEIGPGDPPHLGPPCARETALAVLPSISRLVVVLDRSGPLELCGPPASYVAILDLETLAPIGAPLTFSGESILAEAQVDERTIVLGDSAHLKLSWLDVAAGTVRGGFTLPPDIARNDNFVPDVVYQPSIDGVLMSIGRNSPAIYQVREHGGVGPRAISFEVAAGPVAVLPWPLDPNLALDEGTGLDSAGDWPAYLVLYDASKAHYLPGAQRIGHGAAGRMIRDPAGGGIWFLLPWEAVAVNLVSP